MCENDWRATNCPGFGDVFCDCPFYVATCEGAWTCDDIMIIAAETIAYYDTNGDNGINLEDSIESDHYEILSEYCDFNNDGTISSCEVHDCVEICENEWRDENCPDYGYVYCQCPFEDYSPPETCPGEWTCADIEWIAASDFDYLDANLDG
jgi:hypothetical protein